MCRPSFSAAPFVDPRATATYNRIQQAAALQHPDCPMPRSITEAYGELIHYTTAGGLAGILSSHSLWATHTAFLNDASEITTFLDRRLPGLLQQEVRAALVDVSRNTNDAKVIADWGGIDKASEDTVAGLVHSIRTSTLTFNKPYVLSFSAAHDPRVSQDGLLSQWRGYGTDGGYAIVFDTSGLHSLLEAEGAVFGYQFAQWADVHYYDEGSHAPEPAEEILQAEEALRKAVADFVRTRNSDALDPTYEAVSMLSCLYKHWGFHEEREIRVVVVPSNDEIANAQQKPVRAPRFFLRNGAPVPYLPLFESLPDRRLPILRVIVGPHREKLQRRTAVESMLAAHGINVPVLVSEIPYIGR